MYWLTRLSRVVLLLVLLGVFHETAVRWMLEPSGGSNWHREGRATPLGLQVISALPSPCPHPCGLSSRKLDLFHDYWATPKNTDRRRNCQASLTPVLRTPVQYRSAFSWSKQSGARPTWRRSGMRWMAGRGCWRPSLERSDHGWGWARQQDEAVRDRSQRWHLGFEPEFPIPW